MNNTLVHNNKSKQAHQIATKRPVQNKVITSLTYIGHLQEMPPAQIVQGAFLYYNSKVYIRKCT